MRTTTMQEIRRSPPFTESSSAPFGLFAIVTVVQAFVSIAA